MRSFSAILQLFCLLFCPLFFLFSGFHHGNDHIDRPNVILIIADQMRGDALGVTGHPDIRTPNLDRVANEGVLFKNFFVNNPVCVPSRMSLHSGLYPHQHGSIANTESVRFEEIEGTLLGYFKEKGYKLGWFGKDNHSYSRTLLDEVLDANTSRKREPFRRYTANIPPYWYSDTPWPHEELYPFKTTNDAINFIKETHPSDPFFTVLSLFNPHPPYFAPAEFVSHYNPKTLTLPSYIDPASLNPRLANHQRAMLYDQLGEAELRAAMAHYYAAIEWGVDYQVGRILKTLEDENISDNSIIIITSDHGDFMGEFGMVRKGLFLYDALLHVPLIWYAPGRISAGHQSEAMAQGIDLFPTLVDLLDGEHKKEVLDTLPGRSLHSFLQGDSETNSEHYIFAGAGYNELPEGYFKSPEPPFYAPPNQDANPFHSRVFKLTNPPRYRTAMLRTKDWKLILSETQPPELYKMQGISSETTNLAGLSEYQVMLEEMKSNLESIWHWDNEK